MAFKLDAFVDLFKQGKAVANPAAWKSGTIAINAVVGVVAAIAAIAAGFGYDFNLSQATMEQAAGGIIAFAGIFNAVMHVITSKKVGTQPAATPVPVEVQPSAESAATEVRPDGSTENSGG